MHFTSQNVTPLIRPNPKLPQPAPSISNSPSAPQHPMQPIARLLQCALILLLFCLPFQAFTVFLGLYYFGKTLFLELVWPTPPDEPRPFRLIGTRTSDLFRSSLFVLVLPYLLLGIALFLQASSSIFARLSTHIPYRNAAASFSVECVLQASSLISHVPFN